MARKLPWFTSGMAICPVNIVHRLVFSVRPLFASWNPPEPQTQLWLPNKLGFAPPSLSCSSSKGNLLQAAPILLQALATCHCTNTLFSSL